MAIARGSAYLTTHGAGWRFRRIVPHDVRGVAGTAHWTRYLGQITKAEALIQARALAVEHDRFIAAVRRMTPQERAEVIAHGGIRRMRNVANSIEGLSNMMGQLADLPVAFDHDDVAEQAIMVAEARRDSISMRTEAEKIQAIARKATPRSNGGSLMGLVEAWERVTRPRGPKQVERMQRYARRFTEAVGELTPKQVTSAHARAWRDALDKDAMLSRDTVAQHLSSLHRLFVVATSEGLAGGESNPFAGVRARPKTDARFADDDGRKAFSRAQVQALFDAAVDESADFQMVLTQLAYHGARSTEICQLRGEDVGREDGILVMRIHDKHGHVKNRFSVRTIPVHPQCAGIEALASERIGQWLFLTYGAPRDAGGKFQREGGRLLRRKAKILDSVLTLHSLRHTWRTLAREINMPIDVSSAIMGHSLGKGDHAGYGGVPSLKVRAEWMAKIDPLG